MVKCISIIANFGIFCNISVMIIKLHTLSPNHKNRRVRCMAGGWCQLGVTAADLDKRLYAAFYSGPLATCHSMTPQQVLRCIKAINTRVDGIIASFLINCDSAAAFHIPTSTDYHHPPKRHHKISVSSPTLASFDQNQLQQQPVEPSQ